MRRPLTTGEEASSSHSGSAKATATHVQTAEVLPYRLSIPDNFWHILLQPSSAASTAYPSGTSSAFLALPPKLCCLLEHLYSDSESYVRDGNDMSEWFFIASGVRQGCVVAPDLFNCVIEHIMCQLKTAGGPLLGIDLDNWRLTDMDYADDIALFSPSSEDLSYVLRTLSKEAVMVGMSISWTKTKAMMIPFF